MNKMRLRFAPSPTGPLHMGGVRTALYNYLLAKKNGGDFILRIEDTDQGRWVEGAEEHIYASLEWCGIIPDEGPRNGGTCAPYRQSERKEKYREHAMRLINEGNAYYAFDTPEELETMRKRLEQEKSSSRQYDANTRMQMRNSLTLPNAEVNSLINAGTPYVIRIQLPGEGRLYMKDLIRGDVEVDVATLDDKVLFKSDGMPTYHLANVVDDYLMGITHVIRGEEWLPSAPLHYFLYKYLGWEDKRPAFAHLPLILKPDGKGKLSKRDCDKLGVPVFAVGWKDPQTGEFSAGYKEQGYLPSAFVNMLAMLGWNPGTEQEIFQLPELIQSFSLDRVGKSGARFDMDKVKWFQEQHFRSQSIQILATEVRQTSEEWAAISEDKLHAVIELMRERVASVDQLINESRFFLLAPDAYDEETVRKKWKPETEQILKGFASVLQNLPDFSPQPLEEAFKAFMEEGGYPFGTGMIGLRLTVTGKGGGPSLFHTMALLGREEVVERINRGTEFIKATLTLPLPDRPNYNRTNE